MIQVYTGNGKGKTTAALGLAMRAAGHGFKVYMIQFMKGRTNYGELETARLIPNFEIVQFGRPSFVDKDNPAKEDVEEAKEALEHARKILMSGKYDVVILDEVNVAIEWGLLDVQDVLELLDNKPDSTELVLTGRYAHPKVLERADLATEVVEVQHPFKKGIHSRKGIDY